ncbi:flavin-containing monooxygenase [Microbacterium rhizomatis]|uniref:NAD(P)/FAD-dependent oxidoreductase n=1 Tax=Microbacterium rhizomatis TaxID=1631477 RepID=A0A5J5J108_9MICO|nr:NAD(P)/FAD-dependent oxidoreductase [Microbacterium rhizomatis]KAA9108272.1 NAD(P)/FAD-dependent oxidoreductase [Microbacterium rhizomatis]
MTRVEVAIVGAGFAGLGMAMALRRSGRESFVILERAASVGGTWRDNTYPGVACDVPSHLYGFAAHPHPGWSGVYARGDEIHRYLQDVAEREHLGDRLRLHTPMLSARWSDGRWLVETGGATPGLIEADALVLACGRLTEPEVPDIAGLEGFAGPLFHSARWDHTVDMAGARVAVVGTGASAIQLVPELARVADHVTLFQRTPAWIVPRDARPYADAERDLFATHPEALDRLRAELYTEGEARFASRSGDAEASVRATRIALDHLHAQVADPQLRAALTPDYAFGCKRVLLSDDFYPAVASDRVTLEPSALAEVDGRTLVAADGGRHEADVLVLATGFASTRQPYAPLIRGEDGVTLDEHWSEGMTSFGSTVVSGFPNLFVLNGPNASLGHNSSVLMVEEQAAYAVRALAARDAVGGVLRVDPAAEEAYTDEIARAAASTPWITGGCRNWYVDERSGRLTLLWPGTVDAFRSRLARTDGSEFLGADARRDARVHDGSVRDGKLHDGAVAPDEGEERP